MKARTEAFPTSRGFVFALGFAAASFGTGGCSTPPSDRYYWGSYEACVGGACLDPRPELLQEGIRRLSHDVEKARARGLPVPPGEHAFLGYLHALSGDPAAAAIEYAAEEELYPESHGFVDRLLERGEVEREVHFERVPRSILVLPPLGETPAAQAPCQWLASITQPLAERGYYVFPVVVVGAILAQDGSPTPREMHGVPLEDLRRRFGADAVLYATLEEWVTSYGLLTSETRVSVRARLVDAETGAELWQGEGTAVDDAKSGNQNGLGGMLGTALVSQGPLEALDPAPALARRANREMIRDPVRGLALGPRHQDFAQSP